MITAMAKFRVWARSKYAKVRARFYPKFRTVAQFFARLWSFLLTHWKWEVGLVAAFGIPAILYYRDVIAEAAGYTMTAQGGMSPGIRFFRDLMVGIAAFAGLVIAGLRVAALDSQAKTATEEFGLAQNRLLSDRFAVAAELMGKENNTGKPAISSRISGIYILESLAKKAPTDFVEQAVKNLIAYVKGHAKQTAKRMPSEEGMRNELHMLGEDVKVAFAVLNNILCDAEMSKMVARDILDFSHQDFSWLNFSEGQVNLAHYKKWAGTNFEGAFLISSNFENADLTATNFGEANMQHVRLKGAAMPYATLNKALLTHAVLTQANLREAQIEKATLCYADLRETSLISANVSGSDLSGAKMQGANMFNALFVKADDGTQTSLSGARLDGANLHQANLTGVNMAHANLWGADLSESKLSGVDLSGAKFGGTQMFDVVIDESVLSESVKAAMNENIWHSGGAWTKGIEGCYDDIDWNLEECEDGHALVGVLSNFAQQYETDIGEKALNLRRQVRELFDDENLPEDTPLSCRIWIERIDPETGAHPDDYFDEYEYQV